MSSEEGIYLSSGNGATPGSIRHLRVWRTAMDLAMGVYGLTRTFPEHELEGLSLELHQAAVTIPAKIANGSARFDTPEGLDQLSIAATSLARLETLLELARGLGYAAPDDVASLMDQCAKVGRQLDALRQFLKESS